MQAERVSQDVELAVVDHFIDGRRDAQELLLELRRVLIQRAVRLDGVGARVLVGEIGAELLFRDKLAGPFPEAQADKRSGISDVAWREVTRSGSGCCGRLIVAIG